MINRPRHESINAIAVQQRYRLGDASRLRLDPGQVRQNARGYLIDFLQNHLFFNGLYFGRDKMLDALLGNERDNADQYDEITV